MRGKWIAIGLPALAGFAFIGTAEVARKDFDQLEARVAALEVRMDVVGEAVTNLENALREYAQYGEAEEEEEAGADEETPEVRPEAGGNVIRLPTAVRQWRAFCRFGPRWVEKPRNLLLKGAHRGGFLIECPQEGCGSSAAWVHSTRLEGDFVARALVRYGQAQDHAEGRFGILNLDTKARCTVALPLDEPARIVLSRQDGKLTAQVNEKEAPILKYHAGDALPGRLCFVLGPGDRLYVEIIELYAEPAAPE